VSAYDHDPRVVRVSDTLITLPGGRRVWFDAVSGRWAAAQERDFQLIAIAVFDTEDEAIRHALGEPA
jgi:hypothetical protein